MYTKTVDFGLSLTRFHATVELIPNVLDIVASCVFAFTYFFCLSVLLARSLSFCCFDRLTQSDLRLDNNTLEYNFEMWWILGPFFFRRCCFHFLFTFCRNSFHFVRCVQANYSFCAVLECFFSSSFFFFYFCDALHNFYRFHSHHLISLEWVNFRNVAWIACLTLTAVSRRRQPKATKLSGKKLRARAR